MTPKELERFRQVQELRRENRELMVFTEVWAAAITLAFLLAAIWG